MKKASPKPSGSSSTLSFSRFGPTGCSGRLAGSITWNSGGSQVANRPARYRFVSLLNEGGVSPADPVIIDELSALGSSRIRPPLDEDP